MVVQLPYATPSGHTREVLLHEVYQLFSGAILMAVLTTLTSPLWERLFHFASVSDEIMFVGMTCFIHTGLYLLGWFVFCKLGNEYGWFKQYKLPRTKRMTPSNELVQSCFFDALVNQILKTPMLLFLGVRFLHVASQSTPCPRFQTLVFYYVGSLLWNSWGFYVAHRTLHEIPFLYRSVHKKHHNFVGTISIAAEHAHPIEDLLANSIPTVGFAVLFRVPQPVWFIWLSWRLIETYHGHSGYAIHHPLLTAVGLYCNSKHHDFHHTVNQGNYAGPLQDYFLGTMGPYAHQNNGRVY